MSGRTERPQPTPPSNARTRKWSTMIVVRKDGKWVYERTTRVRHFDMVLRQWVEDKSKRTVDYVSLEEMEIRKVQRLDILLVKKMVDPVEIEPISGFFRVTLECRVPESPEWANHYLTITKYEHHRRTDVRGCFILNDLALGTGQILDMNHMWIKQVSKPERITDEEAQKFVADGEIADVLEAPLKHGKTIRRVVFNVVMG